MDKDLTTIDLMVLEVMNEGKYLMKIDNAEGVGTANAIQTSVKAGTVKRLLEKGLIRKSDVVLHGHKELGAKTAHKYLLTDAGRCYRKI